MKKFCIRLFEETTSRNQEGRFLVKMFDFMQVYEQIGHIAEITPFQAIESDCIFIPHHKVFKIVDKEPKLRVVFNRTAKSETGQVLNKFFVGFEALNGRRKDSE